MGHTRTTNVFVQLHFLPPKTFSNTKKRLQTKHQRGCGRCRKKIFSSGQHPGYLLLYSSFRFFNFDGTTICCISWIGEPAKKGARNILSQRMRLKIYEKRLFWRFVIMVFDKIARTPKLNFQINKRKKINFSN